MEQGPFPRVTIQFCTQCKWMLRAAYFAQELLSTFSTSLGEVALQPSTGGTFLVHLYNAVPDGSGIEGKVTIQQHLLWDRKADGGFPETKELKRRVRDIIDPSRNLGHVDGHKSSTTPVEPSSTPSSTSITTPSSQPTTQQTLPLPKAVNRLQSSSSTTSTSERKFTPMDVDVTSRPGSSFEIRVDKGREERGGREEEVVNSMGLVEIRNTEGAGFCRPGDEDCG